MSPSKPTNSNVSKLTNSNLTFKTNQFQCFKTNQFQCFKTNQFQCRCLALLSRWPTQWPSWQAREPPSSPGKPSLLTEAGVLCVLDRREKYSLEKYSFGEEKNKVWNNTVRKIHYTNLHRGHENHVSLIG